MHSYIYTLALMHKYPYILTPASCQCYIVGQVSDVLWYAQAVQTRPKCHVGTFSHSLCGWHSVLISTTCVWSIWVLCVADFISRKIKLFVHFLKIIIFSTLKFQVRWNLSPWKKGLVYLAYPIPWMFIVWRLFAEPGCQQPSYWPCSLEIFQFPHQKD